MSSGVDNNGEVEVETPPKLLIILLVMVSEAAEVDRTSMLALLGGMAGFASVLKKKLVTCKVNHPLILPAALRPNLAKEAKFL